MTGKAVELVLTLDEVVGNTSPIHSHPAQRETWLEEMKNWTMGRFCEYYNGLPPQGRERFLYIIWQVFHIGTAHSIMDAIFGASAADGRESKMRAERDQAQRELYTAQQETLSVRAQKDEHLRQKGNRIIELEVAEKDLQARIKHLQASLDEQRNNINDVLDTLKSERTAHNRTKAQLEAAEGATRTLSRLLAAAESSAAK